MTLLRKSIKAILNTLRHKGIRSALFALAAGLLIVNFYTAQTEVYAQEKTETNTEATSENKEVSPKIDPEAKATEQSYLAEAGKFDLMEVEDPIVWLLIALFLLAIAVSIERAIHLYRNKGKNDKLIRLLTEGLSRNPDDPSDLINHVRHKRYGMEGRVAAKTLEGWSFGDKSMREFSSAAMQTEQRKLNRWLVVLSTLGNNTPFIGLLGTVIGIMRAFSDLAMMGDAGPAVVMKGISEALIATAFGLGVAIPCVISFNVFSTMVKGKLSNGTEIVDLLLGIRAAFEKEGQKGVQDYAREARSTKDGKLILEDGAVESAPEPA